MSILYDIFEYITSIATSYIPSLLDDNGYKSSDEEESIQSETPIERVIDIPSFVNEEKSIPQINRFVILNNNQYTQNQENTRKKSASCPVFGIYVPLNRNGCITVNDYLSNNEIKKLMFKQKSKSYGDIPVEDETVIWPAKTIKIEQTNIDYFYGNR